MRKENTLVGWVGGCTVVDCVIVENEISENIGGLPWRGDYLESNNISQIVMVEMWKTDGIQ